MVQYTYTLSRWATISHTTTKLSEIPEIEIVLSVYYWLPIMGRVCWNDYTFLHWKCIDSSIEWPSAQNPQFQPSSIFNYSIFITRLIATTNFINLEHFLHLILTIRLSHLLINSPCHSYLIIIVILKFDAAINNNLSRQRYTCTCMYMYVVQLMYKLQRSCEL